MKWLRMEAMTARRATADVSQCSWGSSLIWQRVVRNHQLSLLWEREQWELSFSSLAWKHKVFWETRLSSLSLRSCGTSTYAVSFWKCWTSDCNHQIGCRLSTFKSYACVFIKSFTNWESFDVKPLWRLCSLFKSNRSIPTLLVVTVNRPPRPVQSVRVIVPNVTLLVSPWCWLVNQQINLPALRNELQLVQRSAAQPGADGRSGPGRGYKQGRAAAAALDVANSQGS